MVYQQFTGDSTSTSFQLKYPSTSQFVAVVSLAVPFSKLFYENINLNLIVHDT